MPQAQENKPDNVYESLNLELTGNWKKYQRCRTSCCKAPKRKIVHDLRTTLRRLVAIVDVTRELPFSLKTSKFRKDLKLVLDTVRDLRDLQNQEKELRSKLQSAELKKFQRQLTKQRKKEQKDVKNCLNTVNWKKQDRKYQALSKSLLEGAKNSTQMRQAEPTIQISLASQYQKVENSTHHAVASSPPTLHRARIEAKKYRYSLEATSKIYPVNSQIEDKMKTIQTVLGEIQDTTVLLTFLYEFLVEHKVTDPNSDLIRFIRSTEKRQDESIASFMSKRQQFLDQSRPNFAHKGEDIDKRVSKLRPIGIQVANRSA
ncbi:MAG: CHAD domain-containing protein [Bdellovibrionia bacterium]